MDQEPGQPGGGENQQEPPKAGSALHTNRVRKYLSKASENRWSVVASSMSAIAVIAVSIGLLANNEPDRLGGVELGGEFAASAEEVGDVDTTIENGYSYAFGAFATDTTDYDSYSIPEAPAELKARLVEVMNTSSAFDGVEHINELLQYDDFDVQGNIKVEVMQDLIEIGEAGIE